MTGSRARSDSLTVRLTPDESEWIDSEVRRGTFSTRSEAIHQALERVRRELADSLVAAQYAEGYGSHPFPANDTEQAWADAGELLAVESAEE